MDEPAKKTLLRLVPYALYLMGVREETVEDPGRDLNAFIASWVTQVSFKPPMLVVGVRRDSRSNAMVKASRVFTLNVLASDQKALAQGFFKDVPVTATHMGETPYERAPRTGCPVFPGLLGHLECRVVHVYDGENDHSVVVAEVVDARLRREGKPLTHHETGWHYGG